MKLTRVEQVVRRLAAVFYFTADGRVDFRELVRELAAEFHTRIEMRQIGVRDEAKMLGGYGTCGRPLCCTTFLTSFEPVSIKMAKQQDLSLNPSKLSGLCGRLKCCLRYELPNAKGVVHGGCGSEGGCDNPSGCGTGGGCGCHGLGGCCALPSTRALSRLAICRCLGDPGRCIESNADLSRASRITVGDPAGIGPEIAARAAADPRVLAVCEPILYGPRRARSFRARRAQCRRRPRRLRRRSCAPSTTRSAARSTAIATAPINKEALAAGRPALERPHRSARAPDRRAARGDDVLLRRAAGGAGDGSHSARRRAAALTRELARRRPSRSRPRELPRFGYPRAADRRRRPESARRRARPVRARGGHALSAGHRGVPRATASTCRVRFPADTLFVRARRGEFDVVVACYHDQGLIPVKLLAFGQAVNVTLGLPIIRTSVDHGTAFDIAGRGVADPESMIAAVLLAARLAGRPELAASTRRQPPTSAGAWARRCACRRWARP